MKIRAHLDIGFAGEDRTKIIEIDDSELEGFNAGEIEDLCIGCVERWADEYISTWYDVIED